MRSNCLPLTWYGTFFSAIVLSPRSWFDDVCCALAASGHATAVLLSSDINSRLFRRSNCIRSRRARTAPQDTHFARVSQEVIGSAVVRRTRTEQISSEAPREADAVPHVSPA